MTDAVGCDQVLILVSPSPLPSARGTRTLPTGQVIPSQQRKLGAKVALRLNALLDLGCLWPASWDAWLRICVSKLPPIRGSQTWTCFQGAWVGCLEQVCRWKWGLSICPPSDPADSKKHQSTWKGAMSCYYSCYYCGYYYYYDRRTSLQHDILTTCAHSGDSWQVTLMDR